MRITIFTPIYRRAHMVAHYLAWLERLVVAVEDYSIELNAVIVGSEGEDSARLVSRYPSCTYVEFPNSPLGAKFNAGVLAARRFDPDFVLIMGSDSFVMPSIFAEYARLANGGVPYVGVTDLYMWDAISGRASYWPGYTNERRGKPIGPGRLIRRDLLDGCDWRLYDDTLERGLDHSADRILPAPYAILGKPHLFTEIKGGLCLTTADRFPANELEPVAESMFHDFICEGGPPYG